MGALTELDDRAIDALHEQAAISYGTFKKREVRLNMARGKPALEQLDLVERLLDLPGRGNHMAHDATDCRNYGGIEGLAEARALYARLIGARPENTMVGGNSSLALMHDNIVYSMLKGNPSSPLPWNRAGRIRFLCPTPGYDYHFNMTEEYGIQMISVPLGEDGPDMDRVEALVAEDAAIKGMWCVPKYSNPTGAVYSDAVIERLARMPAAAPDFRIFWDNAYIMHHLTDERIETANLLTACERAGNPDRALMFMSTSKITFPGAGLAVFASSETNMRWFLASASRRSIGPDKVNQLRHMCALPDESALYALMDQYRAIIAPKFDAVYGTFDRLLGDPRVATWTRPKGGYFISLYADGCARRTVELAGEAGIALTPTGAAFPYRNDPDDRHIRVAPTTLSADEVGLAAEGIALAVRLAASEREKARRSLRVT
ncbi:MAG: aminotransferase class I/II-fold pyridoxal phosphate-dependent enzyme [Rhodospirillaceae bacterium]|nr:MAG: aminotransferase class I/II-fold pyridoxal phosphate-dependent enzyme [Rhodospirillaceae bacterium]